VGKELTQLIGQIVDIVMSDGATTRLGRKLEKIDGNRIYFSFKGQEEVLTLEEIDGIYPSDDD
jgi:hypothetical protein